MSLLLLLIHFASATDTPLFTPDETVVTYKEDYIGWNAAFACASPDVVIKTALSDLDARAKEQCKPQSGYAQLIATGIECTSPQMGMQNHGVVTASAKINCY